MDTQPGVHARGADRRRRWFGKAVSVWSLAYGFPHAYWALGGSAGLSVVVPSVADEPWWRPINAAASLVFCGAILVGVAFARSRRPAWPVLAVACLGSAVAAVHGVYGIGARAVTVIAAGPEGAPSHILWDLLVFEPWFLIEGLLLATAGWSSVTTPRSRLAWGTATLAAVLVASVTALLQVRLV